MSQQSKGNYLREFWEPLEGVYDTLWLVRNDKEIPYLDRKQALRTDNTVILKMNCDLGVFRVKVHLGASYPFRGPTITFLDDMCICCKGTVITWHEWAAEQNQLHHIAIQLLMRLRDMLDNLTDDHLTKEQDEGVVGVEVPELL